MVDFDRETSEERKKNAHIIIWNLASHTDKEDMGETLTISTLPEYSLRIHLGYYIPSFWKGQKKKKKKLSKIYFKYLSNMDA